MILSFDAYHKSEQNGPGACWDLSSMETSTDGTTFTYLDGGHMFTDPYNGAGSNDTPVGSREGWCYPGPAGASVPTHSIVDLDSFIGQNVKVRYRMTTDSNTAATAPNGLGHRQLQGRGLPVTNSGFDSRVVPPSFGTAAFWAFGFSSWFSVGAFLGDG